ncbi:MAG: YraN family protein [Rickettsiales bacterium]|nr:YraN family protein [Rickettsiales bacterium]|tara:strand:- start:19474 stop:19872 length:399 start_codon:yes stop_codon:yes gene_type:complete
MPFTQLKKIFSSKTKKNYWPWFRGYIAEVVAGVYLSSLGYKIVSHRVKTPFGEIDLIARKKNIYLFVEVKYRKTHYDSAFSLSYRQTQRIINAANFYQTQISCPTQIRFDVILINRYYLIKHMKNVITVDND